jgi:hypothetical protein
MNNSPRCHAIYNNQNIKSLATTVAYAMDYDDLVAIAYEQLLETYQESPTDFELDWNYFERLKKKDEES